MLSKFKIGLKVCICIFFSKKKNDNDKIEKKRKSMKKNFVLKFD